VAKDLNLRVEQVGPDGIKVSWTDLKFKEDWGAVGNTAFGVGVIITFLGMIPIAMSGGWIVMPVWIGGLVATFVYMRRPEEVPNSVTFGKTTTKHKDNTFTTSEITRIEYGPETQLTGAQTRTAFANENEQPQTLIRLWINDNYAYNISLNTWQTQVNHQIRDTLAKALDQVRAGQAQQNHEATHGKQSDFGMPDL